MRIKIVPCAVAGAIASISCADVIGWTATVRSMQGRTLVDVFAVTNSATDRLVNVYGGRPANPGHVQTNSPGGFLQGVGANGAFRPDGAQGWDDADSFLTVGGSFDSASGTWFADGGTQGDPGWLYAGPGGTAVDGFTSVAGTPVNPWANAVPTGAGWYAVGPGSVARSLASLSPVRLAFSSVGGNSIGASSAIAAAGAYGMLVAHLCVADLEHSRIQWRMGATVRRANGTAQQGEFNFTVGAVPAPGAGAVGLAAALLRSRRRR